MPNLTLTMQLNSALSDLENAIMDLHFSDGEENACTKDWVRTAREKLQNIEDSLTR